MSPTFGGRLRHERERRQIALKSIAESTKIGLPLLEGLERDDVSRWPSGIFRKSFVRSYAEAIGLDADAVVHEFMELFPDPHQAHPPKPQAAAPPSGRVLVKLTITLSGSANDVVDRVAESRLGRLLRSTLRVFAGAAPDPARPA